MSTEKKHRSRLTDKPLVEEDEGSGGGQSGQIEFHDFITNKEQTRDDLLPPAERQRLLAVHKDIHELRVKKQKETRELRQAAKEGKKFAQGLGAGSMGGAMSPYKPNPILANKAQFSGVDKQVIGLPTENIAATNEEKRNELQLQFQHQLQLRYTHDNTPRLTPRNYK